MRCTVCRLSADARARGKRGPDRWKIRNTVRPSVRPSIRPSLMPMAEQCSGQLAWPPAMTAAKTMLGAVAARRRRAGGGRAGDEVFHLTSAEEEEEEEEEGEGSPGNHSTSHILSVSGDACMQDIYSCHSLQVCRACRLLRLRLSRRLQPFSLRPSSRCALLIAPVTRTHCARAHGSWRRGRPREMQTGAPRRAAPRWRRVVIARIRQRVRCSFNRRFAERHRRLLTS